MSLPRPATAETLFLVPLFLPVEDTTSLWNNICNRELAVISGLIAGEVTVATSGAC